MKSQAKSSLLEELQMGNVKYDRAIDYVEGNEDSEAPAPVTVFQSGMPGAMSIEELETDLNLGEWLISIGDQVVMCEVCRLRWIPTIKLVSHSLT